MGPWEENVLNCIIRALEHKMTIIHLCGNFVYSKTLAQHWVQWEKAFYCQ